MIKNLLFDLGGVIIDIERQRCVDAYTALGLKDADSYFGEYAQTGIFMAIEDGSMSVDDFHAAMHALLPEGVTDYQIDNAFQKFIVGIPEHRLKALRDLRRRGFGIYLLSNTNPIMWRGVIANEFGKEGLRRQDYFDGMVTSFEARAAKPDHRIFGYTAEQLGIIPAETLFFDDSTANVEAARQMGFQAVHVAPGTEFTDYLPK
ncbi:MAG: HAD family phosphatase [Muribaculaceae bacterium]|nr:HAD family phosphatase [Muribaculaceae bacterium]MDE6611571.1 HAD family phosphatase [Muribaculaceae bacterium]